jgi:hypothetical protein
MPRSNETLDGSMMAGVGYSVSDRYGPVGVSKFLESLHVTDAMAGNRVESPLVRFLLVLQFFGLKIIVAPYKPIQE